MSMLAAVVCSVAIASPCTFHTSSIEWTACVLPPLECPNGPFTSAEACAASTSTPGCEPQRTVLGWGIGFDTRQREKVHACSSRFNAIFARCQCSGNLFGFCMGPCRPVGGVARMLPCPGNFSTVEHCPQQLVY